MKKLNIKNIKVKKFEYEYVKISPSRMYDIVDELNIRGQEGWELVSVSNWTCFFKREIK